MTTNCDQNHSIHVHWNSVCVPLTSPKPISNVHSISICNFNDQIVQIRVLKEAHMSIKLSNSNRMSCKWKSTLSNLSSRLRSRRCTILNMPDSCIKGHTELFFSLYVFIFQLKYPYSQMLHLQTLKLFCLYCCTVTILILIIPPSQLLAQTIYIFTQNTHTLQVFTFTSLY